MVKDIIFQQKKERDFFLSQTYILRDKLNFAQKFLDTDLIKVITGPRRAGKSIFSIMLLKEKNFAYLNFDDENLLKIKNTDEVIKEIFTIYGKPQFILFDEIQNLPNWELFINKLHRRGYNLIITGSNSRLLSTELATALTGRHLSLEIFPFNFGEFLKAKKFNPNEVFLPETKGRLLNYLELYIKNGGFPEVVCKNYDPKVYLDTLFDAILLKDVVKRYQVRFSQKIYELALYLVANFSCEFSFTKLKNILGFNSVNTLQNYFQYLEEAYLVFHLDRFSYKKKEQIKAAKKIYLVDNGFILAKSLQFTSDQGRLLENLVFSELLKKGYQANKNLFYYKTRNQKEVDFVLKEGLKIKSLIQVASFLDQEVKKREIKALIEASEELNCDELLILNWDEEREERVKGKKIRFIPIWNWLIE